MSLSRTDHAAMCAVTDGAAIGIDVERIRPWSDLEDVANEIASGTVRDARHVLERWTRIEALAKAMGTGLPDDIRSLGVPDVPLEPRTWRRTDGWLWLGCPHPDDCVASLVIGDDGPNGEGRSTCEEHDAGSQGVRHWTIDLPA